MAVTRYILSITVRDYAQRDSVIQYYVKSAPATAWVADPNGVGAAPVKALIDATLALTDGNLVQVQVGRAEVENTVTAVTDPTALRGNKAVINYRANARAFVVSIPARNTATGFVLKPNSVELDLDGNLLPPWITAFEAVATSIDGGTPKVEAGYFAD